MKTVTKFCLKMVQNYLIDVCFWDADGFSFIDRLCTGIDTFG